MSNQFQLWKRLEKVEENSFPILNYFRKSVLLISTFTSRVDHRNLKNYCKGTFFTCTYTCQGVKHWLFYSKYR